MRNLMALTAVVLLASPAAAQVGTPPGSRPAFSPYLNLLRPNASPAVNYYGLVRPQTDFQNSIQQLQQQNNAQQQAITGLEAPAAPLTTGHAVGFMNAGRYFMNLGASGSLARNGPAAPAPASPAARPAAAPARR